MEYLLAILLTKLIAVLLNQLDEIKSLTKVIVPFQSVFSSDTFPAKSPIQVRGTFK